ncbi:hypothetical protein Ddye_005124 [Dipteronia dyeriana]|uniref:MULE transposase domain-containing protein n=1 Tax=Dipteronia dyeriana TaxID=168575 RepID=A0AAD9XFJ5_9ROSI|nr:hypothetical protein Ddye_005124 [Dipteronia dyeriana]
MIGWAFCNEAQLRMEGEKVEQDNVTSCLFDGQLYVEVNRGEERRSDILPSKKFFQRTHLYIRGDSHRHRQASAVIIGEVVAPRLQQQDGQLMHPKDIIANMKTMYGIQIMYGKTYQALDYALSLTYGTYEETFQLLPSFGYVLKEKNPGTMTDLQCDEDDKFLYLFMSLCASLRGFWRCLRPVIAIDGTHLKERFGGTMFVATVQVGNEQVYPIVFCYNDSENNLSWEWFLNCLKGALVHIDDLAFIFDRHPSIEAGIYKVFPYATHTICC